MQTIIMTVGTSLRTNRDDGLAPEQKRPWAGKRILETELAIKDVAQALTWMEKTPLELISAETNTFWRLDPSSDDQIILLHSETVSGLECAQILERFLEEKMGQTNVQIQQLPGINYELDESSGLEQMATLLRNLIEQSQGIITLAATGGFKAQTMIMAIVGNICAVPVCYVHEQYKALIYLPYFSTTSDNPFVRKPSEASISSVNLPDSSKPASEKVKIQDSKQHHRPKIWKKFKKMLEDTPWVEYVRFDENAFNASPNGVKIATRGTKDGRHIFWVHLNESQDTKMAVSVETTGYTREHSEQAAAELRQKLSKLIS